MALFFMHWLTTAVALGVTAWIVPGIHAAALVPGFDIDGFGGAILGALVVGLVSWFIGLFTRGPRRD